MEEMTRYGEGYQPEHEPENPTPPQGGSVVLPRTNDRLVALEALAAAAEALWIVCPVHGTDGPAICKWCTFIAALERVESKP
jgi:NAD(P)H-dependent FMN reductase